MPTVEKFTKTTIELKLLPLQKTMKDKDQKIFWDPKLPGFGLKISARKAVFVAQKRVIVGKEEKTIRHILGDYREFATVDLAREKAGDVLKQMRAGADLNAEKKAVKVSSVTLAQVLNEYLCEYDGTARELRPKTKWVYQTAVTRCFKSWLDLSLIQITEQMVVARHKELSNTNSKRGKGEAQANQAMRVLRTLFNHAIETYKDANGKPILLSNPVRILKAKRLWNENKSRDDIIADDDLQKWYQAVIALNEEYSTVRDYMLVCLLTGLRRTEAARLTWEHVRSQGKHPMLTIPEEDTKTHNEHELPLSDLLVSIFERRRQVRRIDNKFVFPGKNTGTHIIEPKRVIARVVEVSGVEFSMHTLRRTFGTIAGRLDIAHYKHKMLMNHSMKDEVTGSHYVKLTTEDLREPMQKITDYIKQRTGIAGSEPQKLIATDS